MKRMNVLLASCWIIIILASCSGSENDIVKLANQSYNYSYKINPYYKGALDTSITKFDVAFLLNATNMTTTQVTVDLKNATLGKTYKVAFIDVDTTQPYHLANLHRIDFNDVTATTGSNTSTVLALPIDSINTHFKGYVCVALADTGNVFTDSSLLIKGKFGQF